MFRRGDPKGWVEAGEVMVCEGIRPCIVVPLHMADCRVTLEMVCSVAELHEEGRARPFAGVWIQDGVCIPLVVSVERQPKW